jgi:hypothetical protein
MRNETINGHTHIHVYNLPNSMPIIHITAIERQARSGRGLYRNGKQIAYHRSMEMNVNVRTDTVTEIV